MTLSAHLRIGIPALGRESDLSVKHPVHPRVRFYIGGRGEQEQCSRFKMQKSCRRASEAVKAIKIGRGDGENKIPVDIGSY